jgi:hypothetical protein
LIKPFVFLDYAEVPPSEAMFGMHPHSGIAGEWRLSPPPAPAKSGASLFPKCPPVCGHSSDL